MCDGKRISHWYNKWHPFGTLADKYGERVIYDTSLNRMAKVEDVIKVSR